MTDGKIAVVVDTGNDYQCALVIAGVELHKFHSASRGWFEEVARSINAALAPIIQKARDEAYEEAAKVVEKLIEHVPGAGAQAIRKGAWEIAARRIRALAQWGKIISDRMPTKEDIAWAKKEAEDNPPKESR